MTISSFFVYTPKTQQFQPADPAGTVSAGTLVASGTGSTIKWTPSLSGKLLISWYANAFQANATDNTLASMYYGTGTAPVDGAANSGTAVTNKTRSVFPGSTSLSQFIGETAYVSGLTIGTAYWFDINYAAGTGGAGHTAQLKSINCTISEWPN